MATLRADGMAHVVPVWIDVEGDLLVLNTAEGRVWPANARRDPRVTLTIQNMQNPYEFLSIRGRIVEDTHEGADAHIDRMAKKCLGEDTYPYRQPDEQRVIMRVEPDNVFHFAPAAE